MEPVVFYMELIGVLSIPCLFSVFLYKKRKLKTISSTYYSSLIIFALLLLIEHLIFYKEPTDGYCGLPPKIALPVIIIFTTPLTLFLQFIFNWVFKIL